MVKLLLLPLMGVLLLSYSGGYGLSLPDKSNGNSVHGKSVTLPFRARDATKKFASESQGLHSAQSKENDFPADGGVLGSVVEGSDSLSQETLVDEGENDDSSELDDLIDDDSSELDDLIDDDSSELDDLIDDDSSELDDLIDDDSSGIDDLIDDDIVDNFAKIPFEDLSDEDLEVLLLLDDAKFLRQADEHIVIKLLQEQHQALYASGQHGLRRKKRFLGLGLLFGVLGKLVAYSATHIPSVATGYALSAVADNFFGGLVRSDTRRSGQHINQLYIRTGNYTVALQDFQNFRLDNVRSISNGKTGTMEDGLRFTVQNGNPPTLKVRSHDGTLVREIRYEEAE